MVGIFHCHVSFRGGIFTSGIKAAKKSSNWSPKTNGPPTEKNGKHSPKWMNVFTHFFGGNSLKCALKPGVTLPSSFSHSFHKTYVFFSSKKLFTLTIQKKREWYGGLPYERPLTKMGLSTEVFVHPNFPWSGLLMGGPRRHPRNLVTNTGAHLDSR